jgi:2'-5' RNA ligase
MSQIRTFIAVPLDSGVRQRAADLSQQLQASGVKASWTKTDNMHVTLKFLGDVDEHRIEAVCRATQQAAGAMAAFALRLRGAGAFPSVQRPRTVWIGATDGRQEIAELARDIDRALSRLGFAKEKRAFQPHLTIARVRGGGAAQSELGRLIVEQADFDAGISGIHEVRVYASTLGPAGPTYEVLASAPLEAGKAS